MPDTPMWPVRKADSRHDLAGVAPDLAGALTGGAVGLIGGPLGALGGAAIGVAVQRATRAIGEHLSRREQKRVGDALEEFGRDVARRRERGEHLRDDDFFEAHDGMRPDAEELLEGVLRHAAETYEERKVPLLARLYSGVIHDSQIVAADAQFLLRTAADLTYRQFVALAVIFHREEHIRALARARSLHNEGRAVLDPALLVELDDLGNRHLVGLRTGGKVVAVGTTIDTSGPLSATEGGYGAIYLLPVGETLIRLTGAEEIGIDERLRWIEALTGRVDDGV